MKKLLTMAALAAIGVSAYAGCGMGGPGANAAAVWDFSAKVKMVDGRSSSWKTKNPCGDEHGTDYYRVKSSRTFKGVFIDCDPCNSSTPPAFPGIGAPAPLTGDNLVQGNTLFYIASSAQKYGWVYEASHYGTSVEATAANGYEFGLLNFFGGLTALRSKYAEGTVALYFAELDKLGEEKVYSLLAAGFGTRDTRSALVKTLSGQIAGESTSSVYCGYWTQVFEPCTLLGLYDSYNGTVRGGDLAYVPAGGNTWQRARSPMYDAVTGTWSLKYSASKSKLAAGSINAVLDRTFARGYQYLNGTTATAPFTVTFN